MNHEDSPPEPALRIGLGPRPVRPRAPAIRGIALLLAPLALTLLAGTVAAGAGPLSVLDFRQDVERELNRTDDVLARARAHLTDCTSARGQGFLTQAAEIQEKARAAFRSLQDPNGQVRGLETVRRLSLRARDLALQAIETCQVEFQAHEALRDMMDSTQDLLGEARDAVTASGSAEGRRLLEAGLWQLDKAREAYRNREYRKAITLGAAARTLIQRAVQRARSAGLDEGAARVEAALDRTDLILSDVLATPGAADSERARALFDRARKEQGQAWDLYRAGRPEQALRRTRAARATALDALWLVQTGPAEAQIRAAVQTIERLLRETAPGIRRSGPEEAIRLVDRAEEEIRRAGDLLREGKPARAAEAARLADTLLRRAADKGAGE
jgi:hypothetical protein